MRYLADLRDRLERRLERISCRELTEAASEHLDGTLSHPDRRRVMAHLRRCTACRRYVDQLRAAVAALARAPAEGVQPATRERLVAEMRAARRR